MWLILYTTKYVPLQIRSLNKSMTHVNQPSLFTTMDIVSDGFGFMLSVGDLVVVPFTYSLQARYLAFHPVELGPIWTLAILGTNLLGYYIFRTANAEKDDFRNGKNPKSRLFCFLSLSFQVFLTVNTDLTYMSTKRGTKLLTSGWWGRSRHPNYLCVNVPLYTDF